MPTRLPIVSSRFQPAQLQRVSINWERILLLFVFPACSWAALFAGVAWGMLE